MILSSEFNNENIRTIPINMTEWQEKQLAEQYFHLWMLSSIKFPIRWKNWLVFSSKKSCFLQANRTVSIKAFSPFKRLSSLAGEAVYGISAPASSKCTDLAIHGLLQVHEHPLQRPLVGLLKERRKGQPVTFELCDVYFYALISVVYTQSN